jgi:signal transduction histidine kinase
MNVLIMKTDMTHPLEMHLNILFVTTGYQDFHALKEMQSTIPDCKCKLIWAANFEEGMREIKSREYDLCLIENDLGERSGIEFLSELKKDQELTPTILINGGSNHDIDLEAMTLGASDYLVRDQITPYLLERTIRYAIHREKTRALLRERDAELLIQERLASVGLLASGMAHEIGTPLGVIRGRAEVLLMKNQGVLSLSRDLEIIIAQVDRVSSLMKSLLNLARGDSQKHQAALDLRQVIDEVVEIMSQVLRLNGIHIFNEVSEEMPIRVQAESDPFHQILLNLFHNSIHAIETAQKSGEKREHFIRIRAERRDQFWVILFQDSGCGISSENQRKLFRPFYTTKGIGGGTGLGLALSLRIVESWKGMMTVQSELGTGTVITISVPSVANFTSSQAGYDAGASVTQ